MSEQTKLSVLKDIMLEMFDDKSMAIIGIVLIIALRGIWTEIPNEVCTAGVGAMAVVLGKNATKKGDE